MLGFFLRVIAVLALSFSSATATNAEVAEKFHDAVHVGDVTTVRAMLAADPSLATSADEDRFQPVHLLDMYFEREILELLLANGADINARNDEGISILHIITDPEAVNLLIKKGADIEARDNRGRTPLIVQMLNRQNGPDVIAALLENGANPNAKDDSGVTALDIARQSGDEDLIGLMTRSGTRN
ncbi:ankyrin repeat domain-containing protein [Rhizobium leguminosarum]|uniref:ankyrin repeat domain-containing protein n=1 Tax=Rhizobium leguminosarum TaxID=384 RepID=UPI0010402A60|nr:ankyrin repeat domain-containing protein [Rhizobium leguminosarum]TBY71898.1 ankyrin repeat domain-containing protein [Rhizobium leguminosarum bv. viciae]